MARNGKWHWWFAWHPVQVKGRWTWLRWVRRRNRMAAYSHGTPRDKNPGQPPFLRWLK